MMQSYVYHLSLFWTEQLVDRRLRHPLYPVSKVAFHTMVYLLCISALGYTWSVSSEILKYPAFLTSWGLMLATITYLVQFINTIRFCGRAPDPNSRLIQAGQVLHNSNASLCLLITVFYWGLVWPTIDEEFRYSELMDKIAGHGMVPAVVIIDLLLFSPIPKMKRQVIFPIAFAALWFAFSLVYYACGGLGLKVHDKENMGKPYLYKMINWGEYPSRTIGIGFGVCGLLLVIHLFLWLLDQFFVRKCCFKEERRPPGENDNDDEVLAFRNCASMMGEIVAMPETV